MAGHDGDLTDPSDVAHFFRHVVLYDEQGVKEFYRAALAEHGATAKGVGWKSTHHQEVRWAQMFQRTPLPLFSVTSMLDVGCGIGGLVEYLERTRKLWFQTIRYVGVDVVPEYIDVARARHDGYHRTFMESDVQGMARHQGADGAYDLVVCSGALQYHTMGEKLQMLDSMWVLAKRRLMFNMRLSEAYLGDLQMIMPRFGSGRWEMNHNYGLDEVTVIVDKETS